MKTTVEVSDQLFREVKTKAAQEGIKLKDIVEEGFLAFVRAPKAPVRHTKFPIIKAKSPGKRVLPEDIASQVMMQDDLERYEASR